MTDRELLELAAKAAGVVWMDETWPEECDGLMLDFGRGTQHWNPLDNDSDALQLAVRLGMYINIYTSSMHQTNVGIACFGIIEEPHGDDPCAATRRAIVRAAAEMQKAKGET